MLGTLYNVTGFTPAMIHTTAVEEWYGTSMEGASNILFTNGNYDPTSAGRVASDSPGMGVNASNRGLYTYLGEGGAHGLEMLQPNTCDPEPVVEVRRRAVVIMQCWLSGSGGFGGCSSELDAPLPGFKFNSSAGIGGADGNFSFILGGYPWGQGGGGNGAGVGSSLDWRFISILLLISLIAFTGV